MLARFRSRSRTRGAAESVGRRDEGDAGPPSAPAVGSGYASASEGDRGREVRLSTWLSAHLGRTGGPHLSADLRAALGPGRGSSEGPPLARGALGAAAFLALRFGGVPGAVRASAESEVAGARALRALDQLGALRGSGKRRGEGGFPAPRAEGAALTLGRPRPSDRALASAFERGGRRAADALRRRSPASFASEAHTSPCSRELAALVRAANPEERAAVRALVDARFELAEEEGEEEGRAGAGGDGDGAGGARGAEGDDAACPPRAFSEMLLSLPNLRTLRLSGFMLRLSTLGAALPPLPGLSELALRPCACDAEELWAFLRALAASAPALRRLSLRPGGCLWEPYCLDGPLAAAPSLLPALHTLDAGAVRDAGRLFGDLGGDAAFCARARSVVLRCQLPGRRRHHPSSPFGPAARFLRRCPRLERLGVGMDSVATVFSGEADFAELAAAAAAHPALRTLLARTSLDPLRSAAVAPLRGRRVREMVDVIDRDAWGCVEATLMRQGPSRAAAAAPPIRRVPWHFASIRERVSAFVGRRAPFELFHFQVGVAVWFEDGEEGEEGSGLG
jgi:hypothetical protein